MMLDIDQLINQQWMLLQNKPIQEKDKSYLHDLLTCNFESIYIHKISSHLGINQFYILISVFSCGKRCQRKDRLFARVLSKVGASASKSVPRTRNHNRDEQLHLPPHRQRPQSIHTGSTIPNTKRANRSMHLSVRPNP